MIPRRRWRVVNDAIVLLLVAACRGGGDDSESEPAPIVNVRIAVVSEQPFTDAVGAIGSVQARPGHVASLGAPVATRVTNVYVSEGARVSRGQALVELDRAAIDAAASAAESALTAAEQAYARAERLNREGVSPRKDVEQAASDVAKARAESVAARRSAQLAVLHSPIGGVVTRLTAVLGASVDANQPLVEVADPSALDLVFSVTPKDAARIKPGASIALSAGQNTDGEPLGTGSVVHIAATVDSVTRSVLVRARAPGTKRPLRIGETLFGQIVVGIHPRAIAVPADALVPDAEGFKVFVVDSNSLAHARHVTIGARTDSTAEILTGLEAGERVVTYGAYGVDDSVKVSAAVAPKPASVDTSRP